MSHCSISEMLPDFALGRLGAQRGAEIEQHLVACPACRELLGTYVLLGDALTTPRVSEHPASADLAAWAVLEDDLPGEAVAHLAECAACSRELELLAAAIVAARGAGQSEELESRRLGARRRRMAISWAAAAILAFVVLAGSMLLIPRGEVKRNHVLSGVRLMGEETITASSIHASQTEIQTGSDIVFEARELISLGEDFVVAYGATFAAMNTGQPGDGRTTQDSYEPNL